MDRNNEIGIEGADGIDCLRGVVLISKTGGRFEVDGDSLLQTSEYYEALVNSGMKDARCKKLILEMLSDESLTEICEFLSSLQNGDKNIGCQCTTVKSYKMLKEGLKGASYLQISSMSQLYNDLLSKHLETSKYARTLKFASKYMMSDVIKNVREFVLENFRKLQLRSDILTLAPDDIYYLLESDIFNVESEFDIFNFVIRWISVDESRKQHAEKLLTGVRYSLMTASERQKSNEILNELELNICKNENVVENFRTVGTIFALGSSPNMNIHYQEFQTISVYNFLKSTKNENMDPGSTTIQFKTSGRLGPSSMPWSEYKTCMINNCLYVAGGVKHHSLITNELHVYDPVTSTWTQCCSMYVPRKEFYFGEMDGHLYAVSGRTFASLTPTVEKYVPQEDIWVMPALLPVEIARSAGCACNGRLYVSGGFAESITSNQLWRYNPDVNNWTEMARMLFRRTDHIMTSIENKVIAIGGSLCEFMFFNCLDVMTGEIYDCEANQWTNLLTLKKPIFDNAFFTIDNCIYIIGKELNFYNDSIITFVQKINLSKYLEKITTSENDVSNIKNDASNHNINNDDDDYQIFLYQAEKLLNYGFFGVMNSSQKALD